MIEASAEYPSEDALLLNEFPGAAILTIKPAVKHSSGINTYTDFFLFFRKEYSISSNRIICACKQVTRFPPPITTPSKDAKIHQTILFRSHSVQIMPETAVMAE